MPVSEILREFGFDKTSTSVNSFGSGLINNTWMVANGSNNYILQRINHNVFKEPEAIASNIDAIGNYLATVHPDYKFTMPVTSLNGSPMLYKPEEGYFRMFFFVEGSRSIDVVETPDQAYEAAAQFGKFTNFLSGFDVNKLKTTIPDFHNLSLRYKQFQQALKNGNPDRIKETTALTNTLVSYSGVVTAYDKIISSADFKLRVTHHDTKISNVLFDENDKGICVIDLDTVMPGYFISDVGDMMRTYLSPVSEEEKDFDKIEIRDYYYSALVHGYYDEMKDVLTEVEQKYFFYAGTFIVYMQALRFLTDYLNNDIYYGSKYPGQNLVRAGNQAVLLQRLMEKKKTLENIL
jgi:Ser/Thr protein kinase RdoA (MazF antagonist)